MILFSEYFISPILVVFTVIEIYMLGVTIYTTRLDCGGDHDLVGGRESPRAKSCDL